MSKGSDTEKHLASMKIEDGAGNAIEGQSWSECQTEESVNSSRP